MSGFLGVPVGAAYYLVSALAHLLTPVAGGLATAAAIVLFTAAVRLLISPLSLHALRGQAAMARLAPQVQALRTRYGRQPDRFGRELTALYKREGTGPFAGILPQLAQWPFLSVTYLLFRSVTVDGARNRLLSDGLFGVPLGAHWLSGAGLLSVHNALFLAIFAILAALCRLSARLARRAAPAAAAPAAAAPAAAAPAADAPAERRSGPLPAAPAAPAIHAPAKRRAGRAPAAPALAGQDRGTAGKGAGKKASGAGSSLARPSGVRPSGVRPSGVRPSGVRPSGVRPSGVRPSGVRRPVAGARPDPAEAHAGSKAAGVLTRVLPYVTVVIAAFAPLAAAIYLLTTVAWTLAERRLFLRLPAPRRADQPAGAPVPETR